MYINMGPRGPLKYTSLDTCHFASTASIPPLCWFSLLHSQTKGSRGKFSIPALVEACDSSSILGQREIFSSRGKPMAQLGPMRASLYWGVLCKCWEKDTFLAIAAGSPFATKQESAHACGWQNGQRWQSGRSNWAWWLWWRPWLHTGLKFVLHPFHHCKSHCHVMGKHWTPEFKLWLYYLLIMWPWAFHLTSSSSIKWG